MFYSKIYNINRFIDTLCQNMCAFLVLSNILWSVLFLIFILTIFLTILFLIEHEINNIELLLRQGKLQNGHLYTTSDVFCDKLSGWY